MYKGFHGFKLLQIDGAGVNGSMRSAPRWDIRTMRHFVTLAQYRKENRGAYDRLLAPKIIDS